MELEVLDEGPAVCESTFLVQVIRVYIIASIDFERFKTHCSLKSICVCTRVFFAIVLEICFDIHLCSFRGYCTVCCTVSIALAVGEVQLQGFSI